MSVSALPDLGLARERIGLSDLVEHHHHDSRAMAAAIRPGATTVHALLHDRVHDRLLERISHFDGERVESTIAGRGDVGFTATRLRKVTVRGFEVGALVHVDVDDQRVDLVARHLQRRIKIARS